MSVDPLGANLIMGRTAVFVTFTITIPLNMITTLILVFFFYELTHNSKYGLLFPPLPSFMLCPECKPPASSRARPPRCLFVRYEVLSQ